MKNRAKCKLCNEILESFHEFDYVTCKCGEISISGGDIRLECSAKNWNHFLRVDDDGNEIIVRVDGEKSKKDDLPPLTTQNDKIKMLEDMIQNLEGLPKNVMISPINHYDLYSYLLIILSILKSEK